MSLNIPTFITVFIPSILRIIYSFFYVTQVFKGAICGSKFNHNLGFIIHYFFIVHLL